MTNTRLGFDDVEAVFTIQAALQGLVDRHAISPLTPEIVHKQGRLIGTLVFEMTPIYTGFASVNALKAKYKESKKPVKPGEEKTKLSWTLDHLTPRQVSGNRIVSAVLEDGYVDGAKLHRMLNEARKVNRVTKQENTALRPHQSVKAFVDAETAYKAVGIELREWPNNTRLSKLADIHPDIC